MGGLFLPDGSIAVADYLDSRIRIYGPSGTHVAECGGPGEGPGEFTSISRMFRYRGDSILVADMTGRRLSVRAASGAFGRLVWLRPRSHATDEMLPVQSCCQVWGGLADGSLLIGSPELVPLQGAEPRWSRVVVDRHAPDGAFAGSLGALRSGQYRTRVSGSGRPIDIHYDNRLLVTPWRDGYVATDGLSRSVRYYDEEGRLQLVARLLRPHLPVTRELRAATRAAYDRKAADIGPAAAAGSGILAVRDRAYPDSLPAADSDHHLGATLHPDRSSDPGNELDLDELGRQRQTRGHEDGAGDVWLR